MSSEKNELQETLRQELTKQEQFVRRRHAQRLAYWTTALIHGARETLANCCSPISGLSDEEAALIKTIATECASIQEPVQRLENCWSQLTAIWLKQSLLRPTPTQASTETDASAASIDKPASSQPPAD